MTKHLDRTNTASDHVVHTARGLSELPSPSAKSVRPPREDSARDQQAVDMLTNLPFAGAYEDGTLEHVEIDLQNKPDWYASKVNPASKVPVIRVGEEGAPGTLNIPESAVDLELVADLYPEKKLSPEDPVKRAYARYFAQRYVRNVRETPFCPELTVFLHLICTPVFRTVQFHRRRHFTLYDGTVPRQTRTRRLGLYRH